MERQELETFLTLAEELHFGHTAERLLVSQARVSQTVKKLERSIGGTLFERTSRVVRLSPLGRQLYEDLAPLHRLMEEAVARAKDVARGVEGELGVGFLGAGAGALTQPILKLFRERCPRCEVRMRETQFRDPLGPLRSGDVDVLFTCLPVEEPDLTVGPVVIRRPRVLAMPVDHRLAGRASLSWEDLAGETCFGVVNSAPSYWWDFQVPPRTPSGREIRRGQAVATFQELMTLIATGQGVSPVIASVETYYARPDIAFVPVPDLPAAEVAAVWRTGTPSAPARAFAQAVHDTLEANGGPAAF
ncbi:LysR family transcriptional regulator [Streptomyces spectabilis]|uniref:DNA-binding transcriptional LysR family regulator n=1 Tax=Streptomyces spectabilis TaxID=68270 RepID=A0A7W8ETR3_STRST|nr:LysR family transcriptional regulator [Streptomyces spectabilis]MBB5103811.1 DNA-binding transcriptional LysR family regulator [Streptomyces spectabilis]MCI3903951.1 LysR family transcriptional regulator [Streptomyces spectabilis]GGV18634.1 LysR family transcriptional regulator [Streptomyces spectabilis]